MQSLTWFWPHPFPGRNDLVSEDAETRTTLGPSGTIERYWKNKSGTPEHVGWDCESREKWEGEYKPAFLNQGITINLEWIYGDMAFKNMTFCSPATYRELIWPQHKRIADWAHTHGMKMIFHSDGDLRRVMDCYIEAGFDGLQPLESKASMDIRDLAPMYGNEISFFGNIDIMKLITNDLDLIEEEIRSKFAAGMAQKGYLYHSDHSIPPQVSWATYREVIRMINQHDSY